METSPASSPRKSVPTKDRQLEPIKADQESTNQSGVCWEPFIDELANEDIQEGAEREGRGNCGGDLSIAELVEVVDNPEEQDEHVVLHKRELKQIHRVRGFSSVVDLKDVRHAAGIFAYSHLLFRQAFFGDKH